MSINTKVLALKYRPVNLDQLIGQEIVAQTIYNSIKLNKIPNAYLFTGIRGVGKTTTARIIAKALNCKNGIENLCKDNFCENCKSIIKSNHIDVLEMDAASKTGVDDVRDLIEFSKYGPSIAKYKIFIIDEVHMLSKQAFNALLKTLEEPPDYLKFIFATTEIKKIPITVISRCQRFDLSRVKSEELFNFIKKIKDKEKGNIKDEALKLIVKISEGSVRDALSLLDRALITSKKNKELDLEEANKIFGFFDKSNLIELFKFLLEGREKKVIEIYKKIYEKGVEPKIFMNDFLEILYYIKNISSLRLSGNNFLLNDQEHKQIVDLAKNLDDETLILYWQFAIKSIDELDIVSNQNLSVEMFLIRLLYIKKIVDPDSKKQLNLDTYDIQLNKEKEIVKSAGNKNNQTISQIKNITQEENLKPKDEFKKAEESLRINNFEDLINLCDKKKEVKLKYELETNVNLVNFENQRIEISFNENLDRNFVKELSAKLYEWTNSRWIISFSKKQGLVSIKEKQKNKKKQIIEDSKKSEIYKKFINFFPDAELIKKEEDKSDE